MTSSIYCFHHDLGVPHFNALVPYWQRIWKVHGWTPNVLTLNDAKRHPLYPQLYAHAKALPTINRGDFNWLNCVRWLAFAQIDGAVTDSDVFPRVKHYPPKEYPSRYCADAGGGPGFIVGSSSDFLHIGKTILGYTPKPEDVTRHNSSEAFRPHVSDMIILHHDNYLSRHSDIECYGLDGWLNKPLVHFGNAYLKRPWGQKVAEIQSVLSEQEAPN